MKELQKRRTKIRVPLWIFMQETLKKLAEGFLVAPPLDQ
jgi:hypothetical protein